MRGGSTLLRVADVEGLGGRAGPQGTWNCFRCPSAAKHEAVTRTSGLRKLRRRSPLVGAWS